jgi:baseplate J-like protein
MTQYFCASQQRRSAVGKSTSLNGIDFLEVASADQKTLAVHFLHPLPGEPGGIPANPALTADNVVIDGGVRVRNIGVVSVNSAGVVLTVAVNSSGDFSTYTLRLVSSPSDPKSPPPAGFDPQLAAVSFSFKATCPSEFDCRVEAECPPPALTQPEINYLAKDYASFRRLMLDRLSVLMPDWRERSPADLQIALVELLAYVGDHLSYYQDAVATEAYLGTARKRVSVRRHARLLDYVMHDGCNARAWVCLTVEPQADGKVLPGPNPNERKPGTRLLTRCSDASVTVSEGDEGKALAEQPIVFETMHRLTLHAAHNKISFYTWSDAQCCLPRGSTKATLRDNQSPLQLSPGDVLIFEEVLSPTTGLAADADPTHRQAVRLTKVTPGKDLLDGTRIVEIEWHKQDALTCPLCVTALVRDESGQEKLSEVSVARGNVVLADQGRSLRDRPLVPPQVPGNGPYRPRLADRGIAQAVKYEDGEARDSAAAVALNQDPRQALPAVRLRLGEEEWSPRRDLLASDRFDTHFVVEMEEDGAAHLRFGDDVQGRLPAAGGEFVADYRLAAGRRGNVGAGAIARVVTSLSGIAAVRNPLPASGGSDGEPLERVRQFAPQAFRVQERAVTEADYAAAAERHPEVQKAAATFRWTGSWYTVFVTIDRKGGLPIATGGFAQTIREHIEQFRLAGYDLEIGDPVFVPLDLALLVCVAPGYFRSDVKARLLAALGRRELPSGQRGFFHPDQFTFGQPVYLSRVYQAAMAVPGVASVEVKRFHRYRHKPAGEIDDGLIAPALLEIVRLDNDLNFPENGRLELELHGGL